MKFRLKARTLVLLFLAVSLFLPSAYSKLDSSWLSGESGYDKAFSELRNEKKPFVIYFYTTWCPYCKGFERKVLKSKAFEKAFQNITKVGINVEDEEEIASEFGVESFPQIFAVFPGGKAVELPSYPDLQDFLAASQEAGLPVEK